jgi:hypothetical protein
MAIDRPVSTREEEATIVPPEPEYLVVPAAFYRDDEPPEPPEGDPHWREFPIFDAMKGSRWVVAAIVLGVCLVTLAHLAVLFFI